MKRYTLSELEKQAIALGATHYRRSYVKVSVYVNHNRKEVFSTHFFNSEDNEVCYYIDSAQLYEICGMSVFETPRVWGEPAKTHEDVGQPIDVYNYCVKQL